MENSTPPFFSLILQILSHLKDVYLLIICKHQTMVRNIYVSPEPCKHKGGWSLSMTHILILYQCNSYIIKYVYKLAFILKAPITFPISKHEPFAAGTYIFFHHTCTQFYGISRIYTGDILEFYSNLEEGLIQG